ncbi:hypothetical protein TNCV_1668571 [Trichonephila clavipes]|nr:hypothetical protein TNCV_1668571 [Trichonephila clavipes]
MHLPYRTAHESNRPARQVYERCSLHSNVHDTGRRQLTRTVNVEEQVNRSQSEHQHTHYCSATWDLSVSSVAYTVRAGWASLPSAKSAVTATK